MLNSIDLSLGERLKDSEFRREWFRAELESRVPELFRDLRESRGWTQAELAAKADMKQSAISRFEGSTEAVWKLETLFRLADALDAQLSITLEPAERVIAQYASEWPTASKSVLEALDRAAHEHLEFDSSPTVRAYESSIAVRREPNDRPKGILEEKRPWS